MLPHAELAARLAEAYRLIAGLTAQAQQLTVQARELSARGAGTDVCGIPGRARTPVTCGSRVRLGLRGRRADPVLMVSRAAS